MNTLLTVALIAALFLICSVRELTPEARSPRELVEIVRAHGWHSVGGVLRVTVVVVLLVLAEACRVGWLALQASGVVLAALAVQAQEVGTRKPLESA